MGGVDGREALSGCHVCVCRMFVLQFYLGTANIQLGVMTGANELETVAQQRRAAGDAADDDTDFAAKLEAAESSRAFWTSVLGWIIPW